MHHWILEEFKKSMQLQHIALLIAHCTTDCAIIRYTED